MLRQLCIGLALVLRLSSGSEECTFLEGQPLLDCCSRLRTEALYACLEYEQFGFTGQTCLTWIEIVEEYCYIAPCGECKSVADPLRQLCEFQLQVLGDINLIKKYCGQTYDRFLNYRCPPACNITKEKDWCTTDEAKYCMSECGNGYTCECRKREGTTQSDVCVGETVVQASPTRPELYFDCALIPGMCVHSNLSSPCGMYKYCEPDLCLIEQVDCSPRHQCEDEGVCDPQKGMCFWNNRFNGYPCDDEIFYTLNDSCQEGFCIGVPNYCVAYNVTCKPMSDCLVGGTCHAASGRCTYDQVPDETLCDDGRKYTVEDKCKDGLCVGRAQDMCEEFGIVCQADNWCYDAGTCEPKTGECSKPTLATTWRPCNDRDDATSNDSCIDGVCMGYLDEYKFLTMGEGECADREGRRMARYTGDVETEKLCEGFCRGDPQCAAFSYAFPLCSIYGTVRVSAPTDRDWSFQAGTDPPALIVETTIGGLPGQRLSVCRKKGVVGDTIIKPSDIEVEVDDFFTPIRISVTALVFLACFFAFPIVGFFKKVCLCRPDIGEIEHMKVGQDPSVFEDGAGGQQDGQAALRDTADGNLALPPPQANPLDDAPPPPPPEDSDSGGARTPTSGAGDNPNAAETPGTPR